MAETIRVLVADDHAVVREGLRTFLQLQDGLEVVGEAADGDEALRAAERLRPDVLLLDQLAGVELVERVRAAVPGVRVVILSGFAPGNGDPALEAAADAYVVKTSGLDVLAAAVRGG